MQLPYEAEMLKFHEQDLTVENARMIKDWENLGKPVMNANKQKYRSAFSELEIRYIESCCKPEMNFFGYSPDFESGEADELARRMRMFEKDFADPPQELSALEVVVRQKRLEVIERIINRHSVSHFSNQP